MNQPLRARRWALLPESLRGMFNLNDPRWGRGEDRSAGESDDTRDTPERPTQSPVNERPRPSKSTGSGQPPDLDELWRDLNRKLSGLFGGKN